MDKKQIAYDLAMLYAKEILRRMDDKQVEDIVQTTPKIKETFDVAYEVLSGVLPEEDEM